MSGLCHAIQFSPGPCPTRMREDGCAKRLSLRCMNFILTAIFLKGKDLSDFIIQGSQMDTSKEERLSLQDDKSGLNDFGLRQSKRRKSSKEEDCTNVSCGVEIQSLRDISLTGTPLLDAANGVSLSANFVKSADGLARISRKPTKSRRESCISKPFGRDSPRIPLRSSIKNTKSPENEIDLIMTGPCCKLRAFAFNPCFKAI